MTERRSSLTGSWSGAFRYPDNATPETVFNAQIEERSGAFVGATQEPNIVDPELNLTFLTADIEGTRMGETVVFTKFYDGEADEGFAVRYEGSVDADLMRIEGRWTNPLESGTFFMTRDDLGEEEAIERDVEAPIEGRK